MARLSQLRPPVSVLPAGVPWFGRGRVGVGVPPVPVPEGVEAWKGLMNPGEVEEPPGLGILLPGVGSKATHPTVGK